MTDLPSADQQLGFLFKIQRLLTEGTFEATYKFALLLSLAELAVERGNDDTSTLTLDTADMAEKVIELYWRQVLPWCFRQFYTLISDLVQTAWVRFVQRVPRNQAAFGQIPELRDFLFGSDRSGLARFAKVLADLQNGRCFYCDRPMRTLHVDHFVAWSRYPLDLGHNFVGADDSCNSAKCDRLPALGHLERWVERNRNSDLADAFDRAGLPHDHVTTTRVAAWAYEAADRSDALLWVKGKNDLEPLPAGWRRRLGWDQGSMLGP